MSYQVALPDNVIEYADAAALGAVPTLTTLDGQLAAIVNEGLFKFLKFGTNTVNGTSVIAGLNGGQWCGLFSVLGENFLYINSADNSVNNTTAGSIALASAKMLVGNAGGVATAVDLSGDATVDNAGVITIAASAITNAKVSASAAIAFAKLATLASGNILVGSAGGVATSVAVTGDVTISNAGVTAIGSAKVVLAMLATGIAPAYVNKAAGTVAYAGGGTSTTDTIAGMVDADIVSVWLIDCTNIVALKASHSGTTLTITFASDPGAGTVVGYSVLRAAA